MITGEVNHTCRDDKVLGVQMHILPAPILTNRILDPDKVALNKLHDLPFHPLVTRSAENADWVTFMQSAWAKATFASHCLHWAAVVREGGGVYLHVSGLRESGVQPAAALHAARTALRPLPVVQSKPLPCAKNWLLPANVNVLPVNDAKSGCTALPVLITNSCEVRGSASTANQQL